MLPAASELDLDGAGSQSHRSLLLAESLPRVRELLGPLGGVRLLFRRCLHAAPLHVSPLGLAWRRCDTSCLRSFLLCSCFLQSLSCSFSPVPAVVFPPLLLLSLSPFSPLPNSHLGAGSCTAAPALSGAGWEAGGFLSFLSHTSSSPLLTSPSSPLSC